MKQINFKTYKFRASQLGKLMVGNFGLSDSQKRELKKFAEKEESGKELTKLQAEKKEELLKLQASPKLSETTITYLKELFIEETFGRRKEISNKYIEKGNLVEDDNIKLLSDYDGETYQKNEEHFSNDYLKGTPDIITDASVKDIKSSWDIFTFFKSYMTKDYEYQLKAYSILTGKPNLELCYVLGNTPEHLLQDELQKSKWRLQIIDEDVDPVWLAEEERLTKLANYDDIPLPLRVRRFAFTYQGEDKEEIYERIWACREWLDNYQSTIFNERI